MSSCKTVRRIGCGLLLAAALAGCAKAPGLLFEPTGTDFRWPQPPDEARIRYVGQLRADEDLKPGVGFGERVGRTLFGKKDARTMLSPLAICTDGPGQRLFIADSNAQVIHMFDLVARKYEQWRPPPKTAALSQPVALAWDPAPPGRLLVSDSVAGAIFVFDAKGGFSGTLGQGRLIRPVGLAVDPATRRIFVADAAAHQVVILGADGVDLGRMGSRGSAPGQFNYPTNVALDHQGRLYVSDSLNFRVQVFGPDLQAIRQIGRKGDMPGYFAQPKGLAVDAQDNLYVVDANFEAVQLFDAQGALLMSFGREGHGPGEFWLPAGIHIDAAGRIWVADSYNRRVQVFELLPTAAAAPAAQGILP